MFNVYELKVKNYLLDDISLEDSLREIISIVDKSFLSDEKYHKFHTENKFKQYSISGFTPIEKDRVFNKGKIYNFSIRSVNQELINYLSKTIVNLYTGKIKVLRVEIKHIPKGTLEKIYTLTPAIAKFEKGYWEQIASNNELQDRIKINLIKKYKDYTGEQINLEEAKFYSSFSIDNKYPIPFKYKTIKLLGDKFTFHIKGDSLSQTLAYFALATGILEMSSRGAGFVGYKYMEVGGRNAE